MPRLRRINATDYPYFATTRVHDGTAIFSVAENADIMLSAIYHWRRLGRYYLLGFVIMPDHLHLLIQPRGQDTMSSIMQSLKGYASWAINKQHGRKGKLWQAGFYDYGLETEQKLLRRMQYMHDNPVRQGLVEEARDYRYSSAYPANGTDLDLFF